MNTYLIIFAIFLMVVLIALIVFLCFIALRFSGQNSSKTNKSEDSDDTLEEVQIKKSPFCTDHEDTFAAGTCSIDMHSYCELCITKVDDMKFARKNIDEYLNYNWVELTMFKHIKTQYDFNNRIFKVKSKLWNELKTPLIIRGHFKINVEDDSIEAFTTLMCREDDKKLMQKELSFIKL